MKGTPLDIKNGLIKQFCNCKCKFQDFTIPEKIPRLLTNEPLDPEHFLLSPEVHHFTALSPER